MERSYSKRSDASNGSRSNSRGRSASTSHRSFEGTRRPSSSNRGSRNDDSREFGKPSRFSGSRDENGSRERRSSFGERRGSSEGRSFSHNSSSSGERRSSFGERRGSSEGRGFSSERRGGFGERRTNSENRGFASKERSSYSDKPKSFTKGGRSFDKKFVKNAEPRKFKEKVDDGSVRLNKYIANSGVCSRREADTYIKTGLVTVNGTIVTDMGVKVDPAKDEIRFNGERLKGEKPVYIVMNKPKNFVTTLSDPHADKIVIDLISKERCPERVLPVGRLDKATTGVLMFTNDGHMAEKLTHPSYHVKKIYQVTLDKNLKRTDFDTILAGIKLEDGEIHADALSYIDGEQDVVGIEIHSGRNRIIRRIFEHLGYKVKKLDRVYFAGLTKKNLRRGEWRFLTEKEVNLLKMGAFE